MPRKKAECLHETRIMKNDLNGSIPVEGVNDFKTANPDLMLDWDYEKNKDIDPKKITAHSGIYVNWKCHFCGHEWRTRANNRSSLKRGCPNCSMKNTSFGEQAVYYYVKKFFPNAINRFSDSKFELDIFIPDIKKAINEKLSEINAYVVNKDMKEFTLKIGPLTDAEREIITKGCLINYYKSQK